MKEIPCPHQRTKLPKHEPEMPDHFPLTKEEIAELLEEAKTAENSLVVKIQIRLCQGIPGFVCPPLLEGPIFDKEVEISELYVANRHKGAIFKLVEKLHSIMVR